MAISIITSTKHKESTFNMGLVAYGSSDEESEVEEVKEEVKVRF